MQTDPWSERTDPRWHRRGWLAGFAAAVMAGFGGGAAADEAQPQRVMLDLAAARLELQFAPGFETRQREALRAWVKRSAQAVVAYLGRFPLRHVELQLLPVEGSGVRGGSTYPDPAPWVRLRVGRAVTRAQLLDDWILVHEMIHLALPQLPRANNWLHEGLATYVEGVVRGRAGLVAPQEVWQSWARAMPQGLPEPGDRGLDHTPTWGRTYWGGAIFWLLADVRIHQRSNGRQGLQQALQGVLAAGGDYRVAWSAERLLAAADAAVGQTTLSEQYAQMKDQPAPVDLAALWHELGVEPAGLRDDAPQAAVRRAILD